MATQKRERLVLVLVHSIAEQLGLHVCMCPPAPLRSPCSARESIFAQERQLMTIECVGLRSHGAEKNDKGEVCHNA